MSWTASSGSPLAGEAAEVPERLREEVVAGHDDQVVVDLLALDDEADVADRPEPVLLAHRAVVDDGHVAPRRDHSRNWPANFAFVTT